eukprot:COSAG02_NODE_15247_length_1190_cov_1.191567_2_plen_26_part_01
MSPNEFCDQPVLSCGLHVRESVSTTQ